jgi:hypothetical protein
LKSKRFIKTTGRGMYSVLETREEWTTPQDDFL